MLAKFLHRNQNFIPILIMLIWAALFYVLHPASLNNINTLISSGLLLVSMVVSIIVVQQLSYLKENYFFTFLMALGSLILSCCLDDVRFYIGFFFINLVFSQLFSLHMLKFQWLNAFDLGFFMGVAIMFYPPFWIFGLFMIMHFVSLGKIEFHRLIINFLGILTFVLLFFEIIAVFDLWYIWENVKSYIFIDGFTWSRSYLFLMPITCIGFWAIWDYFKNYNRQEANKKRIFFDAILLMGACFVYTALYGEKTENFVLLFLLPISLYIHNLLRHHKIYWKKEVTLWLMVICLLLFRFKDHLTMPEIFESVSF